MERNWLCYEFAATLMERANIGEFGDWIKLRIGGLGSLDEMKKLGETYHEVTRSLWEKSDEYK